MAPQALSDVPELTAIERVGPRGYLRYVFPMRLADGYDMAEVTRVLAGGYAAACQRVGFMASEAVPDPAARQANVLKMQRLPAAEVGDVVVQDWRAPEAYPHTYEALRAQRFAVKLFDGDTLFRRHIWPAPGQKLAVSLAQLNFIRGGVLVGWAVLHLAGDANAYRTWTQIWAEECRRLQGDPISAPFVVEPAMMADRARFVTPSGRNPGRLEDHPEFTVLPFTPTGPPPQMTSRSHRGQIFYFSPAALAALKAEADPAHALQQPTGDTTWISTHDAFAALVWRATVATQSPLADLSDDDDPVSIFTIAIDTRTRADPPVHPHTVGCFLGWATVSRPVRQLLGPACTLADLAVAIRQEVQRRLTPQFADDYIALIDRLDDVTRLVPTAFFDLMRTSCLLTSWANMDLYDVSWGPLLGGSIEAVRCPNNGILPGCAVILPRLPDGGIELLVGTEGALLPKLCADPLWTKFAEAR